MKTSWEQDGEQRQVVAPVSLIVTAFAPVADVRASLTPQLRTDAGDSVLILVDLGRGRHRMGGSILAQTYNQVGETVPDIDAPQDLRAFFVTIRTLAEAGTILSRPFRRRPVRHADRMAFAGRTGISVNLDMLTFDPQSADWGDYKIRPEQVAVQRDELTLKALFSEEAGAVIQVPAAQRDAVMQVLRGAGLSAHSHVIGGLNAADEIEFYRDGKKVWGQPRADLGRAWSEVSYRIMARRDNPACAQAELDVWSDTQDPGMQPNVDFDPQEDIAAPYIATGKRPRVAILREQGCNSQVEMGWAFDTAGFEAYDVHMTDLLAGRVDLAGMQGLVAVGGFSYGDVLGAGEGWARTIRFNSRLSDQFAAAHFALGVCNGCQMMAALAPIPGAEAWPRFTRNLSEVRGAPGPGGTGQVAVDLLRRHGRRAHPGGRGARRRLCRFLAGRRRPRADDRALHRQPRPGHRGLSVQPTAGGLTSVTTADGRFTVMMPHPERVTRNVMMSWAPKVGQGRRRRHVQPLDAHVPQRTRLAEVKRQA